LLALACPAVADDAHTCFVAAGSPASGDVAIAACTRAVNSKVGRPGANYSNRGNAYNFKGDKDHALADYSEAILLDSKLANAYTNRGLLYEKVGEKEKAQSDFLAALQGSFAKLPFDKARERLAALSAPPSPVTDTPRAPGAVASITPVAVNDRRVALVIGNSTYG
jgi:TPR repeat